jgi:hypothetical protein
VAVIYTELIKLLICIGAQARECLRTASERDHTMFGEIRHQAEEILGKSFPMFVPAALFVMQQVGRSKTSYLCYWAGHDWIEFCSAASSQRLLLG